MIALITKKRIIAFKIKIFQNCYSQTTNDTYMNACFESLFFNVYRVASFLRLMEENPIAEDKYFGKMYIFVRNKSIVHLQ